MTSVHIRARLSPWEDTDFVRAFEQARDEVEGTDADAGPAAALQVERRLHAAGYPNARIDVTRSFSEALEHASHWDVRRDG
jgi:hypothetical protein